MVKFFKKNILISIILVFAIFIVISYIITKDMPELFRYAEDIYNVLFQLSIGYIISFVFYVLQVYIPNVKQTKYTNDCINSRLFTIISKMEELFTRISKLYLKRNDIENFSSEDFLNLFRSIKQNDYTSALKPDRMGTEKEHYTVKEWILYCVEYIEHEIDAIYKYYPLYIDSDLMKHLESILNSGMHKSMARLYLQIPPENCPFDKAESETFFSSYYNLENELKFLLNKRKGG